ncbi:hypothetical protein [Brevifollis gellanilyticus]|uniref:Uncharacterized protein n=1 Tax=Brevifollis gellanilyticus TaxID=748831 RepID=A0A512MHY4_9BACT|nr:hypothetical protein [Brevifollis gellanilyticus]GEP45941.1 hypothetical protein BGE01nite_52320 [Brevifollis gellanilyticus]
MPRIQCQKHGITGVAAVCEHMGSDFDLSRPLRAHRSIRFADTDPDPLAFTVDLCGDCLRSCSIGDDISTAPLETTLDAHPQLESPRMLCIRCFRDYQDTIPLVSTAPNT